MVKFTFQISMRLRVRDSYGSTVLLADDAHAFPHEFRDLSVGLLLIGLDRLQIVAVEQVIRHVRFLSGGEEGGYNGVLRPVH